MFDFAQRFNASNCSEHCASKIFVTDRVSSRVLSHVVLSHVHQ